MRPIRFTTVVRTDIIEQDGHHYGREEWQQHTRDTSQEEQDLIIKRTETVRGSSEFTIEMEYKLLKSILH